MFFRISWCLCIALFLLLPLSTFAEDYEISLFFYGLNWSHPYASQNVAGAKVNLTTQTESGGGYGFFVARKINGMPILIETGLIFSNERYTLVVPPSLGLTYEYIQSQRFHFPLLFRYAPTRTPMVSFGLGGYYENGLGDLDVGGNTPGTTSTMSYSAMGIGKWEWGLDADVRFRLDLYKKVGLVVDGRYKLGLTNRLLDSTNGASFRSSNWAIYGGWSLLL